MFREHHISNISSEISFYNLAIKYNCVTLLYALAVYQ